MSGGGGGQQTLAGRNRWIQGGLALEVTVGAVAGFLDDAFAKLHKDVIGSVGAQKAAKAAGGSPLYIPRGKKCTVADAADDVHVKGCVGCRKHRDGPCMDQSPLWDAFEPLHSNYAKKPKSLEQSNSHARKWGTLGCHIEVAKLFCKALGSHEHAIEKVSFADLDGTALFNILSHCSIFHADYCTVRGASRK
eukprot:COSAG01_NODE_18329_length_1084_cov_1.765482_1_plen_192_part_00